MNKAEILAPAGAMPQLIAALRAGADAVYFGSKNFNARRKAENFDDLSSAVSYCHARGAKAYITFNTLLLEKELSAAADEIEAISLAGADAVIIQDVAAAELFRKICPNMPLHASTQMSIHNLSGVKQLEDIGFSRAVLARELSREELIKIAKNTDMELEVFVHGAHCMSVSGQCYMSSILGLRSGNRGLCAQPCRLDWKLGKKNFALSLKDMSIIDMIPELYDLGICSMKIEGRMKRPEYVAAAVRECVRARDGEKADTEILEKVFSRSGFTKGYYKNELNSSMFGIRTDEDAAKSAAVLKSIENEFRNEVQRVEISMSFSAKSGKNTELTVFDGINSFSVCGSIPEEAKSSAATADSVSQSLLKCGGTVFLPKEINCNIDSALYIPKSEINALRTKALSGLMELREKPNSYSVSGFKPKKAQIPNRSFIKNKYRAILSSFGSFSPELADKVSLVALPAEELLKNISALKPYINKLAVSAPPFISSLDEADYRIKLEKLFTFRIKHAFVPNLGAIQLLSGLGFILHGTYRLNITNSLAASAYSKLGLEDIEISIEANVNNSEYLNSTAKASALIYGRLPLMLLRACPAFSQKGCTSCGGSVMTDRLGKKFRLFCAGRKYQEVLNSCPLWLADKLSDFKNFEYWDFLFSTESKNECIQIIEKYEKGESLDGEFTRALYFRDVL